MNLLHWVNHNREVGIQHSRGFIQAYWGPINRRGGRRHRESCRARSDPIDFGILENVSAGVVEGAYSHNTAVTLVFIGHHNML